MKKYTKYIGALIAFFLLCASITVITKNSETLSEYAQREPEIALAVAPETEPSAEDADAGDNSNVNTGPEMEASDEKPGGAETTDAADNSNANTGSETEETEMSMQNPDRITYQPDFYYEPLSEDLKKRVTGLSYKEDCPIPYEDLRYVSVLYVNLKGNTSAGELICNKAIAQDLVEIFYELYQADYQIEQIRLVDEYGADDVLSMQDNNTSCFNYRTVAGTNRISMHGQGLAVDINPFFNPYITYRDGKECISPTGAEAYADRSKPFAYKIDENDLCYQLFTEHGFSWGGHWNHSKDYQHFEKKIEE